MNDFHATTIDWGLFVSRFEEAGLGPRLEAAMADGDQDTASADAQAFLWEEGGGEWPTTLGFFRLGELASFYDSNRDKLKNEVTLCLDALFDPFVACWFSGARKGRQAFDLPDTMNLLKCGGLSIAIDPEHCQSIALAVADPGWSACVVPDLLAIVEPAKQDLIMEETNKLRDLVTAAAISSTGLLVIFEI
jgi:hypothetical protein